MSELHKGSVISNENFSELKHMMTSDDEASVNLALTILEQSNYEESEIYIMCIIKDAYDKVFGKLSEFKLRTPELSEKIIKSLSNTEQDITKLSFEYIYNLVIKRNKQEELEFVLSLLNDELIELLKTMGYQFVNFTDVIIKPQGWLQDVEAKLNQLKLEHG